MATLSSKRQITLPKALCDQLQVSPGDDLTFAEYRGQITLIKKTKGAAAGILKQLKSHKKTSDTESLQDTLNEKHARHKAKRKTA